MLVRGDVLGKKVCEIFGLESEKVRRVDIRLAADQVAHINVQRYITEEESGELTLLLEKFNVVVNEDG